jgi:glucose/arabinose dehydrogenase
MRYHRTMRLAAVPAAGLTLALLVPGAGARAQGQLQPELRAQLYASGFSAPIAFVQDPSDPTLQFVVEQGGRIRAVRGGTVLAPDFLDLRASVLSGGERGLLGMAFAPDYVASGRFYVNFTNTLGHTVIARFRRSSDPAVADPGSRFDLRWGAVQQPFIVQPFSNHNGGHLAFGADGYLYIGLGDGGSGDDPDHLAQTPGTLLGKMLRIDVNVPDSHPAGYVIPADNPFITGAGGTLPEIWSFGLRNPWRYSFDPGTGAMLIGDVGQNAWEEINYEPAGRGGRNYGWRNREGAHDHVTSRPPAFLPLTDPIHEYDHSLGRSVTGGHVYRGSALGSAYVGRYFFGDFVRSRVWSVGLTIGANGEATASARTEHTAELGGTTELANVASFGVDASGELYVVSYTRGAVLKIVSAVPSTPTGLRIVR